jgi:GNAT superfamily N-acetyltransferase
MTDPAWIVRTMAVDPTLQHGIQALIDSVWPSFVLEGHSAGRYAPPDWFGIYERWPQFQFGVFDPDQGDMIAAGNALALRWEQPLDDLPDEGWDWVMDAAAHDRDAGRQPNLMCALSITIDRAYQGKGLSTRVVQTMHELGRRAGLTTLIAPVRPTAKSRYPITPIGDYMAWHTADGLPFDPWLRVHVRLGARIVRPCANSMSITGSVAEWERWSGLRLPASGNFVVPGLLARLSVDHDAGVGLYVEPNVWMVHGE